MRIIQRAWQAVLAARDIPADMAAGSLITAAVLVLVLVLRSFGMLESLELMTYDHLIVSRAVDYGTQPRVVQIGITEDDISRVGWPLPDAVLAKAIDRLHTAGAAAIGIDIFRPAPVGDARSLEEALARAQEVVWADRFSQTDWNGLSAPTIIQASQRNGFTDFVLDRGGVARRALLYLNDRRHWEEALSLKLALLYLQPFGIADHADEHGHLRLGRTSLPPLGKPLGGYVSDVDIRGYQVLLEFRGPNRVESFPLGSLLDGRVPQISLRGRIVLLGSTADSVKDYFATPLNVAAEHEMYGVTLQALFADQLVAVALNGVSPTAPVSHGWETLLIVLAITGGGCAGMFLRKPLPFTAAMTSGALALLAVCHACFGRGIWLPALPMTGGWILAGVAATASITYIERTQRSLLMRLFSAHVSAPIAIELWKRRDEFVRHERTIPVRLKATVLFADINDFTAASERMEPELLVRWLSPYMDKMSALIEQHGGVVERLAGDCIMAMFGPPVVRRRQHEVRADATAALGFALQMQEALAGLNASFQAEGLPKMRVGIGIHSGELVSCSLGSAKRQQYATIGDTTNVAARIMAVAKDRLRQEQAASYCCIVISHATSILLDRPVDLLPLGPMACKGKTDPVDCYVANAKPAVGNAAGD